MKAKVSLTIAVFFLATAGSSKEPPENLRTENLVAWCIVPFDASKRSPEQRARMLKELGMTRCAYDSMMRVI